MQELNGVLLRADPHDGKAGGPGSPPAPRGMGSRSPRSHTAGEHNDQHVVADMSKPRRPEGSVGSPLCWGRRHQALSSVRGAADQGSQPCKTTPVWREGFFKGKSAAAKRGNGC